MHEQEICESLRFASAARWVALLDDGGGVLASAGRADGFDASATARSFNLMLAANGVVFDIQTSLGLVRLRTRKAIADLTESTPSPRSDGGGESGGPAPAHAPQLQRRDN
jgi:hypothetical protein